MDEGSTTRSLAAKLSFSSCIDLIIKNKLQIDEKVLRRFAKRVLCLEHGPSTVNMDDL